MFNTLNIGIGLVLVVSPKDVPLVQETICPTYPIGVIEEGNKVKVSLIFRGREITHQEIGKELMQKFIEALEDISKVDSPLKFEGKNLSVVMTPDKTKKKK